MNPFHFHKNIKIATGYLRESLGLVFGQCGGHVVQLGGQAKVQNGKITPEQERT
jgi:hypothetical protein